MRFWISAAVLSLCCAAPAAALGESIFDFESVAAGTNGSFSLTVNNLTASFAGSAAVCASTGLQGNLFLTLTGNSLMQGFCLMPADGSTPAASPITITFSHTLSHVAFAVAINGTDPAPVTVTYTWHGTQVGTQTITPVVPASSLSPEAAVTYAGRFDAVQISSTALLAIDNLDAVPAGWSK